MIAAKKTYFAINSKREVEYSIYKRQRAEYAVISAFVKSALAAGHTLGVNNGEETVVKYSKSYKQIMGAIMSTDEERILVYPKSATSGPRMGWVMLVYGNSGWDVICDCTENVEHLLVKAGEVSDKLSEKM